MGVIPVNENDKGFNFDGESSKTFDLIITGGAIFDAPERDVELIEIPGRNGALVQDLGRFKNVTVTYNCALTSTKEHEFVDAMRKVREWLCSKRGYCRLWDDFNPGEYRLGMFKGYIEVTNEAPVVGRFDLSFDCMPQRFLLNGDNPVAVSDGGSIFNPTMFDAKPLLQVYGHGDIGINGETISVSDVPIGRVILANAEQTDGGRTYYTGNQYTFTIDPAALDTGDDIYGMYMDGNRLIGRGLTYTIYALTAPGYGPLTGTVARISEHAFDFEYGTADTFTIVNNNQQYEILRLSDVQTITGVLKYRIEVAYDGDRTITITPYYTGTTFTEGIQQQGILFGLGHDTVYGDSTVSALGTPLLIDLDIGEAFKEENGEIISSNAGVSLPAELPVLQPGSNTITFDNTVTELDIVPRWWEV